MKKRYSVVLLAVVMSAVATCAEEAKSEKLLGTVLGLLPPSDGPKELGLKAGDTIVCLGDSITAGGGYLRDMDDVLAQQFADLKIPKIINAGVSGNKAENMIARFEKDVLNRKPTVVTINVGINDVWHRLKTPHDEQVLATYKENVTKMVAQAQAAGARVVLLAPTIIQENSEAEGNKRLPLYVDTLKQIAKEKNCAFANLHELFLAALKKKPAEEKGNWLTGDGVHMKPYGNAIMAIGALRALGVPDEKMAATSITPPPPKPPKAPPKK